MLGGLGAAWYRHRWLTVVVWIAGVACLITLWMGFGAAATTVLPGVTRGRRCSTSTSPPSRGTRSTTAVIGMLGLLVLR